MTPTYKHLLRPFIAFKSISTDPQFQPDISKAADWLVETFTKHGLTTTKVIGYGNPVVVARYQTDPAANTVLIYGHYDVQPAANTDGWHSDPFTATERKGRIFARGAVDNKGQVLVHIATVFDLIAEGKLAYNVVFVIEGDEESGSEHLPAFIQDNASLLACDFVLVSDGEAAGNRPTLDVGFRGVINLQISLATSDRELHSGLFGGGVPNAAQELSNLLASLWDEGHRVAIPGFYDDAEPVDPQLAHAAAHFPVSHTEILELSGCKTLNITTHQNFFHRSSLLPSLEITGIHTGYGGEGFRNSIPARAEAKINIRTAPAQSPTKQAEKIVAHLQAKAPAHVTLTATADQLGPGIMLDHSHGYAQRARQAMHYAYGTVPIMRVCGGTIPIAAAFDSILGVPQVYASIGNADCFMHAANENFSIDALSKGLAFSRAFLGK